MNAAAATGETIEEGTEHHDFGVRDFTKARRIVGASVRYYVRVVVAGERVWDSNRRAYLEPGTYYAIYAQATRNREHFGACQSPHYFLTEAERHEFGARYVKDAQVRATRKWTVK